MIKQIGHDRLAALLREDGKFSRELGIRLEEVGEDYARGSIAVGKKHTNPMGMVHGGCIYSLADTIAGIAASARGDVMVTTSGTMNYLEAAVNTTVITAVARQLRFGRHMAVYRVEIVNDKGQTLAEGTFSYFNTGAIGGEPGIQTAKETTD